MIETEPLDTRLIAALCRDARADVRDIAAAVDAVPTTVQKRLQALEDTGVIGGYTARIDYGTFGYETVVFRLGVGLDAIDAVTDRLRDRREFTTVYQTSGPETVFAIASFESVDAVAACLSELHDDPAVRTVEMDRIVSTHGEGDCPIPDRDSD